MEINTVIIEFTESSGDIKKRITWTEHKRLWKLVNKY